MKAKNEMFPQSHFKTQSAWPVAANNQSNYWSTRTLWHDSYH